MAFNLDELTDHDGTGDCPICRTVESQREAWQFMVHFPA